jgi:hypothetical protein
LRGGGGGGRLVGLLGGIPINQFVLLACLGRTRVRDDALVHEADDGGAAEHRLAVDASLGRCCLLQTTVTATANNDSERQVITARSSKQRWTSAINGGGSEHECGHAGGGECGCGG